MPYERPSIVLRCIILASELHLGDFCRSSATDKALLSQMPSGKPRFAIGLEWTLLHAATAARPEEAFGLKVENCDRKKCQINIRRAGQREKNNFRATAFEMRRRWRSPCRVAEEAWA